MNQMISVDIIKAPIIIEHSEMISSIGLVPVGMPGSAGLPGPPGTTDHGAQTGLGDDDHPQYLNTSRGDVRYYPRADADAADAAVLAAAIQRGNHTGAQAIATVTGLQTALDGKEAAANKGQPNGYAGLDAGGKVPAGQLPSYVDDVVEVATVAALPGTGEAGIIYVTIDTGRTYRWSGSAYVEISPSPGSTDSVAEGATHLYHTSGRVNALISAAVGSVTQAFSATLDALAGVATAAFGRSLLTLSTAAALRTTIALPNSTTVGRLARYTDTAGAQGQTTGIFEDASGNVGVGTAAPTSKLTMYGGPLRVEYAAPTFNAWHYSLFGEPVLGHTVQTFYDTNKVLDLYYSTGGAGVIEGAKFEFGTRLGGATNTSSSFEIAPRGRVGTRTSMYFNDAGNVGIGTTAPACRLDVAGPMRTAPVTVATLPSAALGDGMRHFVTDSNQSLAAGHGTVVASGGTDKVPVVSFGGQWWIG